VPSGEPSALPSGEPF